MLPGRSTAAALTNTTDELAGVGQMLQHHCCTQLLQTAETRPRQQNCMRNIYIGLACAALLHKLQKQQTIRTSCVCTRPACLSSGSILRTHTYSGEAVLMMPEASDCTADSATSWQICFLSPAACYASKAPHRHCQHIREGDPAHCTAWNGMAWHEQHSAA